MEPNNFEKDFREKLNQRKIEPSDKAWDRLDAMLNVAEKEEPVVRSHSFLALRKRGLYIAASIVGFLLVGTFFFNQKKSVVETPVKNVVVEQNSPKDTIEKQNILNTTLDKKEVVVSEKTAIQNAQHSKNTEKISNEKLSKITKNNEKQVAESSINNQSSQAVNHQMPASEKQKNEAVEVLLNTAEKTIVAENTAKTKAKVKVNANDLLQQVDGELELSFREKVITKVNKNYQTVKGALANRNQQD
ncbi:hypothetical protein SGQ83_06085 [Flavobacterium sp. Fl-318]|uniref:Anti-sigma factor n=1 Tax=Flavobacterium cupriresistens TaxID=2893885 RepID=A0ABU4R8K9_9FLAO|nr:MULTISPECIES: hypothetical protein [unclassified Flavobacterium]MDX6188909.1 hypothetical protein [Flavobacterium sp. Fl-318]UFH44309.1 hypothetical protein LNP23_08825 [Flavobacterium sp. F-323]